MEARKGRAKIRSEPLPPSSPSFAISASRHRYKLPICSKRGIFPGVWRGSCCSPSPSKILPSKRSKHARGVVGSSDRFSCELRPTDKSASPLPLLPRARVIALVLYVPCTRPRQRATNRRLTRLTSRITGPRKPLTRRLFSSRRHPAYAKANPRESSISRWLVEASRVDDSRGRGKILDIAERLGHLLSGYSL